MPHFSEALETLLYPPWREHYLDYRGLKNVIKGSSKPQRSGSSFENPLRPPSPAPLEAPLLGAASTELAATRTPGHDREASFAAALEGDARRVDAFCAGASRRRGASTTSRRSSTSSAASCGR